MSEALEIAAKLEAEAKAKEEAREREREARWERIVEGDPVLAELMVDVARRFGEFAVPSVPKRVRQSFEEEERDVGTEG